MNVFVAGATGALGRPLVRALVERGHGVVGVTRSPARRSLVESTGARAVVADVLDEGAIAAALAGAAPDVVVHALTALPPAGPRRPRELHATNALRTTGTRHLLKAAIDAGARRFVAESFLAVYGPAMFTEPRNEDPPLPDAGSGPFREAVLALRELERQLALASAAGAIETVALRFGGFYGPGVASTNDLVRQIRAGRAFAPAGGGGLMPFIHIDDAVAATVAAIDHGRTGAAYNIVDDEAVAVSQFIATAAEVLGGRAPLRVPLWLLRLVAPLAAELVSWRIPLSNTRARTELGWAPVYATVRAGWRGFAHERRAA